MDTAEEGAEQPTAATDGAAQVLGGRYLLEECIANGGMAAVWRAHDELLARTVAVKVLHDHLAADDAFRERFRREAIAAAKLTHPNVVSLYDTGQSEGTVFLVMEFVDGVTLRRVIADLGMLDPEQAATVGEKIARALAYAHDRGLVHRDVKPANILLSDDGTVKVADFGIAKVAEAAEDLTRTGTVLGTAAYVAPEQVLGQEVDGRTDQYALGCVLYETLTGRQPFKGENAVATAAQRLESDPLPLRSLRPDIPRELDDIVRRAMSRAPQDRFPSATQLADALSPFAAPDHTRAIPGLVRTPGGTGPGGTHGGAAGARGPAADESFLRSEGRWLAPVLALLLLAGALVGVGLATGVLESGDGFPIQFARDGVERGGGAQLVPAVAISAFDPPPGDGVENDADLTHLLDGNPQTHWRTELYDNAALGNLKDGVGFWVDLGSAHEIDAVALRTSTPGVRYEVRLADAPAPSVDAWTLAGTVESAGPEVTEVALAEQVEGRYLLIWITGQLQPRNGRYTAEFSALAIRGRAL